MPHPSDGELSRAIDDCDAFSFGPYMAHLHHTNGEILVPTWYVEDINTGDAMTRDGKVVDDDTEYRDWQFNSSEAVVVAHQLAMRAREATVAEPATATATRADDSMPHDAYMAAVAEALTDHGFAPDRWWTETPDGEQLDGVFEYKTGHDLMVGEFSKGGFVGWDQRAGWNVTSTHLIARTLIPLDLDVYAHPVEVALAAIHEMTDAAEPPRSRQADAVRRAVEAWEADR